MKNELFNKVYSDESLIDLEEDIAMAIYHSIIPQDENGFYKGSFRVIVEWTDENE